MKFEFVTKTQFLYGNFKRNKSMFMVFEKSFQNHQFKVSFIFEEFRKNLYKNTISFLFHCKALNTFL